MAVFTICYTKYVQHVTKQTVHGQGRRRIIVEFDDIIDIIIIVVAVTTINIILPIQQQ